MARCLIGCGSNQGARREQLEQAIELLGVMPGITLRAVSRQRETRPIGGPPDQPPFLNGACLVDSVLAPHELLGTLAAVENTLHRDRSERWGPRTIDLDLLLYDDLVLDDQSFDGLALTLPHPRMTTRRFVLEPAVEIAPDLRHPLAGCSLRDLLDNISQPHLHVAVVGVPGCGAAEVAEAVSDATLARLVACPAPIPWRPKDPARPEEWRDALAAAAAPLRRDTWPDDPHGTVADSWLGAFLVAAEDTLPPAEFARFAADHAATAATTIPAHVALVLRVPPTRLAALPAAAAGPDRVRLQERLVETLRRPGPGAPPCRPRSVVIIDAGDPARAIDDAIAAVEATA